MVIYVWGWGGKMGAPSPAQPPIGSAFLTNTFEIQEFMSASVCMHMCSTCMLTSVPKHVRMLTVEAPLGRPPLLPFEPNPL